MGQARLRQARGRKGCDGTKRREYGPADRRQVVRTLSRGASLGLAAWQIGVHRTTLYSWRKKWPDFDEACTKAMAEGERPMVIRGSRGRRLQQRREPCNRFSLARKEAFLEHFAATCDVGAAAEAAGVSRSTIYKHRRKDPAFRADCEQALAQGYAHLEAENLRLRLAALERLRRAGDPEAEAAESDRILALLREHKRNLARTPPPSGPTAWDFERSLDELEKELRAFGVRIDAEEGEERDEREEREEGGD